MSSEIIKKYLKEIKGENKYDLEFINMLENCNDVDENGYTTAEKIIRTIEERYAKDKKNKN